MPDDSTRADAAAKTVAAAVELVTALEGEGCEYAVGGALALGSWSTARGTLDVDVTLFLPPDQPAECVRL